MLQWKIYYLTGYESESFAIHRHPFQVTTVITCLTTRWMWGVMANTICGHVTNCVYALGFSDLDILWLIGYVIMFVINTVIWISIPRQNSVWRTVRALTHRRQMDNIIIYTILRNYCVLNSVCCLCHCLM